jgi:hypothetical protein
MGGPLALGVLVLAAVVLNWLLLSKSGLPSRLGLGIVYAWFLTAFAVFMAAYAIVGLVGTSVQGINGTQEDAQTKATRWDFAVQWSLPKRETLSLIIPGLFGDRVDFGGDERAYWGGMGRDASWERYYHQKLQAGDTVTLGAPGSNPTRLQINSNGELAVPSIPPIKAAGMTRADLQDALNASPLKGLNVEYASGFERHTGRGFYFGLLVVMLGVWAAFQSFRRNNSVFSLQERKMIWFWSVAAVISLVCAHGRFSPLEPLYYWIYMVMPGSSTVRSPEKFLHVMNLAMLVLFGYGVQGLDRKYLFSAIFSNAPMGARIKNWWSRAAAFDKRWVAGSVVAIVLALAGWAIYAISRPAVEKYLAHVRFSPGLAHEVTGYSLVQVAWFVAFLVLYCGLLFLIFTGTFAGRRAKWGGILLGALLVVDLAHADWPYRVFWNYKDKYEVGELNPICKLLADKPYEHRVRKLPIPDEGWFGMLYDIEWNQQTFPYYNIESMEIPQLPRYPTDMAAFEMSGAFPGTPPFTRHWELTNTRFLVGPAVNPDMLNQQLDPVLKRFRLLSVFRLGGKPGVETRSVSDLTAVPLMDGDPALNDQNVPKYMLLEFTGALPRVKLYSNWETNSPAAVSGFKANGLDNTQLQVLQMVGTNDFLTLKKLMSPSFDPSRTVLIDQPLAASASSSNQAPGDVDFESYAPTDIKLKANATTPSVLLLNDRYDEKWHVSVDGKPAELLRCNYIMRGVYLQPGKHEVEFWFRQPVKMLYVNIAAIVVGLGLLGYAIVGTRKCSDVDAEVAETDSEKTEKTASQPR